MSDSDSTKQTDSDDGSNEEGLAEKLVRLRKVADAKKLVRRAMDHPELLGKCTAYVQQLVDEYLKFLVLKASSEDTDATRLSPSGEIDSIWHLHILDTKGYRNTCRFLKAGFIDHNPDGEMEHDAKRRRLSTTIGMYRRIFGYEPHPQFWEVADEGTEEDQNEEDICRVHVICRHVDCRCNGTTGVLTENHVSFSKEEFPAFYSADPHSLFEASSQFFRVVMTTVVLPSRALRSQLSQELTSHMRVSVEELNDSDESFSYKDRVPCKIDCVMECPRHTVASSGTAIQVFVRGGGTEHVTTLRVLPSFSVEHLKYLIKEARGIPMDQQRIIFNSKQLEESQTLSSYDVVNESTLHIHLRLRGC